MINDIEQGSRHPCIYTLSSDNGTIRELEKTLYGRVEIMDTSF